MPCRGLRHRRLNTSTAKRIERLLERIKDPYGHKKGDENEKLALQLIKELIRTGEITANGCPYITEHNSVLDAEGLDIIIPTHWGSIGIQIKSSERTAATFRKEHPDIPCVVIPKSPTNAIVSERLKKAFLSQFERLKRGAVS